MGRVAVMGAGSWGTAFALLCADAGEEVRLWARTAERAEEIERTRRNEPYLGALELPERVRATADPEEALRDAEIVVIAVPSHALRTSLDAWRGLAPREAIHASLVKGIEVDTRLRASEVIRQTLDVPPEQVVVVSGPNLARECAARMPSATVAACPDEEAAKRVQAASHTTWFRVYTNTDVVGVELGGAAKNVIALAAGMAHGLGYGDNTKAMLLTRGLAEMTRLGVAMGGSPITFAGLAGMGDLVATCTSEQSRNRSVGVALASGRSLDDIIAHMNMVAEGVKSSRGILAIAREHGVEMPIAEHVVKVVHENGSVRDMGASLMGRAPTSEFHGIDPVGRR